MSKVSQSVSQSVSQKHLETYQAYSIIRLLVTSILLFFFFIFLKPSLFAVKVDSARCNKSALTWEDIVGHDIVTDAN